MPRGWAGLAMLVWALCWPVPGLAKEAVLVGKLSYFEIWDKAAWEKKQPKKLTVEEALRAMGL